MLHLLLILLPLAKGNNAVFYGMGILFNAFILSDVTGVEINGITIRNYSISGILIDFGSGNRIVNNKIYIENTVKNCYGDGFHSFREQDSDNVFVGNTAIGNRGYGMSIQGTNSLLLNNTLIDNGSGGIIIGEGSNTMGINNIIKDSRVTGYLIFNHDNSFTADNKVLGSRREGVFVQGNYGIVQNNYIAYNRDSGLVLSPLSGENNLLFGNELVCNIPMNIVKSQFNNAFIGNEDTPCAPCQIPGDKCGGCHNEDNRDCQE